MCGCGCQPLEEQAEERRVVTSVPLAQEETPEFQSLAAVIEIDDSRLLVESVSMQDAARLEAGCDAVQHRYGRGEDGWRLFDILVRLKVENENSARRQFAQFSDRIPKCRTG